MTRGFFLRAVAIQGLQESQLRPSHPSLVLNALGLTGRALYLNT
jgi:hypothetical protein